MKAAVKELAKQLDPECWQDYRDQPKNIQIILDARRSQSLTAARKQLTKDQNRDYSRS
jgi:hypothetical protein